MVERFAGRAEVFDFNASIDEIWELAKSKNRILDLVTARNRFHVGLCRLNKGRIVEQNSALQKLIGGSEDGPPGEETLDKNIDQTITMKVREFVFKNTEALEAGTELFSGDFEGRS